MKYFYILMFATFFPMLSLSSRADDSNWKIYASYFNAKKSIKVGSYYYTLANGDLYVYDSEDGSLGSYDKTNALSDFGIYDIAYSKKVNCLLIVYTNGNIDVMQIGGGCCNLPDLKNKSLDDKTLNEVNIYGSKAYISTNSGIVVINLEKYYFENLFNFGQKVNSVLVSENKLYAKTSNGTYVGNKENNLLDAANWTLTTSEDLAKDSEYSTATNENTNDSDALAVVADKIPDSPVRNYTYKLNMVGERLLVAGGNFYYPEVEYTGTAMKYENGRWTSFDEEGPIALVGESTYRNVTDVVQDPKDSEHHWLGTKKSGIYEFENYKLKNHYSYDNSPLTSILPNDTYAKNYVRVTALQYDDDCNLWMCNNQCDTIVRILKKDGTWLSYYYDDISGHPTLDNIMFDSRGWAWINSRRTANNVSKSGFLVVNTNGTIDTQDDDEYKYILSFKNQSGTSYYPDYCYCATEDLDGAVWIGVTDGIFVTFKPETVFDSDFYFTQVKVSRNDGSNLADYLLSGVAVKCITIDGGNRKWIGTLNNGVYLVSANGEQIIEHFTKDNSPLISDEINSIAIDGVTGEVFIATTDGLCSYMGDATDASDDMDNNSLKVFPNPVRPEYSGSVHVTGLMFNSNVKVVNAAGKLVYEGTSIGGEFTWDCCYKTGKRCGSGVYYVLGTDQDGKNGASAKILIVRE